MTLPFYPAHLQALFTNRERELDLLADATAGLAEGRPRHLALFGLRRIGKTLLLLEHAARMLRRGSPGVRPVYLDFEELVTSPELFSRRYVGLVTYWAITGGQDDRTAFLTPVGLLGGPAAGLRSVAQVMAALEQAREDQSAQVSLALDFPEHLAEELGCRLLLMLDEFTELAVLSHYPAVRRPFHVFRAAMQRHSRLGYVVAASAVSALATLIHEGQSPLFLQFESTEIAAFPPDATLALAERILGGTPAPGVGRRLHGLTGGHPFYIHAVASRLMNLPGGTEAMIERATAAKWDPADVDQAFVLEALSRTGQIYNYCRYVFDISLRQARGFGSLKAILQVLAEEDGLTLSEVARRVHKSAPAVRAYLRALQEVDLVVEDAGVYRYRDAVLRYWVAAMEHGIEVDILADRSALAPLLTDLEAQHSLLSRELGVAKESVLRELLRGFAGQSVDGHLLGISGRVKLPAFDRVAAYRSSDGQIEIDALAEDTSGARWAVEVKWRGRAAGEKELAALARKAPRLQAQAWFISRSGFTPAARTYAQVHGVMVSTRADIEKIERAIAGIAPYAKH